ncbi:MAG: tetratricopeptide repeat protein [Alphaproteobacteria bacterium]|nr:tetratricopeptide repeat protein [Alphaproteobacteria bacterium]
MADDSNNFNLTDLDPETRAAAEAAAAEAGLSVEQWISRVVLASAPPPAAAPPPPPAPPRPVIVQTLVPSLHPALGPAGAAPRRVIRPAAPLRPVPAAPPAPPPPPEPPQAKEEEPPKSLEPATPASAAPGAAPNEALSDQALMDALDALVDRVETNERVIGEILTPLEKAVESLERQLDAIDTPPGEPAAPKATEAVVVAVPDETTPRFTDIHPPAKDVPPLLPDMDELEARAEIERDDEALARDSEIIDLDQQLEIPAKGSESALVDESPPPPIVPGAAIQTARMIALGAIFLAFVLVGALAYFWFSQDKGLPVPRPPAPVADTAPEKTHTPGDETPPAAKDDNAETAKAPDAETAARTDGVKPPAQKPPPPQAAAPAAPTPTPAPAPAPTPSPTPAPAPQASTPSPAAPSATPPSQQPLSAPPQASARPGPPAPAAQPPQTAAAPMAAQSAAARTIEQLKNAAMRGEAAAQHDLAILYAQGNGVTQDYREAARWFREAALQGVANAQYNLGVLHERGLGVQKDPLEALLWYLSAAEQNHTAAQYNVGVAYAEGRGIPQNYTEAQKWFLKAAERGLGKAQYNLGILYEEGLGGPTNLIEAYRWYKIAATQDEPDAQRRLGEIARKMNAQQIAKGDELAKQGVKAKAEDTPAGAAPVPAAPPKAKPKS